MTRHTDRKTGKKITLRSVSVASRKLGLYGLSDAIELIPSDDSENSITHRRYDGLWMPIPVEYKHGRRKPDNRDVVQVVAQAMCLEEMYGITIPYGVLYYWGENHREIVGITDEIRSFVSYCSRQMHQIFDSGITPPAEYKPHCRRCSLVDVCMPDLKRRKSVKSYLITNLYEETP